MSYKDTVLPIIRQTREMLLPNWGKVAYEDKGRKFPFDIVTEVDKKVEKFLREKLAEVYPEIKFVIGDVRDLRLNEKFDAILFLGKGSVYLVENKDVLSALNSLKRNETQIIPTQMFLVCRETCQI